LTESDSVAVLQVGARTFTVPVFIQKHSGKCVIESDFTFNEARPNTLISLDCEKALIVRFEKILQPAVEQPPVPPNETEIFEQRLNAARKANPGMADWNLRKQVTAEMFQEGLATQQRARQEQQSNFGTLPSKWQTFSNAAARARNGR